MSERLSILITGAAGFLGRNLAEHLVQAGARVTLNVRREDPDLPAAEQVLVGSAHEVLAGVDLSAYDALAHMASSTNPRTGDESAELRQVSELGTILDLCRSAPRLSFVYPSSGGTVYGNAAGRHREDAPLAPLGPHARAKVASEGLVQQHGQADGLRYKILRCGNPYGPHQMAIRRQGVIAKLLMDLRAGETTEIWGDGSAVRDYFFVGDLCSLIETALGRPDVSGIYNVGSGVGVSIRELIDVIEAVTGTRPSVSFGDSEPAAVNSNVLDPSRAQEAFGWTPRVGLRDGIRATWEWLQANAP